MTQYTCRYCTRADVMLVITTQEPFLSGSPSMPIGRTRALFRSVNQVLQVDGGEALAGTVYMATLPPEHWTLK
jgi:hypothetical protein